MYTTTTSQSSVRMGSGERAAEQPKHHEDRRLKDQNACVCLGHRRIADFADFTEHGGSRSVQGSGFRDDALAECAFRERTLLMQASRVDRLIRAVDVEQATPRPLTVTCRPCLGGSSPTRAT